MEVGVSTACFYPMRTEQAVEEIKKTKAGCVEVFLEARSEYDPEYCKRLKERLDEAGIRVVSVHGFVAGYEPFLFSEYERRAKDALEEFQMVLEAARILGAKLNTFHGNRLEAYTKDFDFKKYAEKFDLLCSVAEEKGIQISWENVSWCQSGNLEFLNKSLEWIRSNNFGFTLDLKQAARANYNYSEYLKIFKNRLLNVHISDLNDKSTCLLPGNGTQNFHRIYKDLRALCYDRALIIEVYHDAFYDTKEVIESVEFLKNIIETGENKSNLSLN